MAKRQVTFIIDPGGAPAWLCVSEQDGETRVIDAGVEREAGTLKEALTHLSTRAAKQHYRPGEVVLLLPPERLACRSLPIGEVRGERLRQAVRFEVSEALGMQESDLCWDIIGEGGREVCWLAARRVDVDEVLESMPTPLQDVSAVVPGLVAGLGLSLATLGLTGPIAYVVSRPGSLSVAVRNESQLVGARTVLVHTSDDSMENRAKIATRELQRMLLYTEEQHPELDVRHGAIAGLDATQLAETIRCPGLQLREVELDAICALPGLRVLDAVRLEEIHAELLAVAWCRMKMKKLPDFLPVELRLPELASTKTVLRKQRTAIALVAGLALAMLTIASVGPWLWAAAVEERVDEAKALLSDMDALQDEERGLREVLKGRVGYGDFFAQLSEKLPESVTLLDAAFDLDGNVNIKGKASGNEEAKKVETILRETGIFSEMRPRRTAKEEKGFIFEMEGKLKAGRKKK